MADTDEDLMIDIEDDKPVVEPDEVVVEGADAAPVEVTKTDEAPPKPVDPEEGIRKLRADLDNERAARAAAEQRANQAEHGIAQAQNQVQDTNLNLVNNAIERVKQNVDVLKSNYAAAAAAGDYSAMADIQADMSANMVDLKQLEAGKIQLENAPKQQPARQQAPDPVEAMASNLTARSAAWVRAHPEFAKNPRLTQRMLAAHNLAVTDDLVPDSDAYFERVESILGLREQPLPGEEPLSAAAEPTQRRSAPPAAPVTRGNGSGNGSKPTRITLSPAQREAAEASGLSYQEYARELLRIQREQGKLN
jgi:hypothetical protein